MEFIKNNKGIIIIIIGFLALIIYNWQDINPGINEPVEAYSASVQNPTTETSETDYILVDIKGEVNYPGLYKIRPDSRIGDLILAAGGETQLADLSEINLAEILQDGSTLTIPKYSDDADYQIISKIKVEIKGEVINPGIYELYTTSRIEDLIQIAGGITEFADLSNINRVMILNDGDTISIPKQTLEPETSKIYVEIGGEILNPGIYYIPENYSLNQLITLAGGVTNNCDVSRIDWDTQLCLGASINIPSYSDEIKESVKPESSKININTANLEALMSLPGIGQIIGQRIIDYRAEFGYFICIEDIMCVSGIKSSVYEQIKELITV